jgi:para-aminobenzoate synthetase/4-amino-4-deoxychorismate lyase
VTVEVSDFQLIETMRVSESGRVYLLDRHLERLNRSAHHFSFTFDLARVRAQILESIPANPVPACLRLLLSQHGLCSLEQLSLPAGYARRLKLSRVRVDSKDVFLYHKTTRRGVYDEARRECDENTDAILCNERGEITETTIMNIAVFRGGRWVTPRLSCGLLPGVMREELLARGEIVEGVVKANELQDAELVKCFNALRGTLEVPFSSA